MKRRAPLFRQRGLALLALVVVVFLAISYLIVSHLHAASGFVAINRNYNAQVMNQAKQALIGYVAQQAAIPGENNPGRLPCPEAPGSYGTSNEGIAAGNCTLPAVGRFPWRTLGLDKLVDSASEPLWYVVSPAWALSNSTTPPLTTYINSNSTGQLSVDGVANDSVALIIAPGPAMVAPAAAGCTAWTQTRPTAPGTLDRRNYLECQNAAGAAFVTTGPGAAFNDQVVRVTVADIMPGIEAGIAVRIEREVASTLRTIYATSSWGANISAAHPVYPFPASFADPSLSAMQGAATNTQGLLPLSYAETAPMSGVACTPSAAAPRCDPSFVAWTGTPTMSSGSTYSADCTASTATQINCTFYYRCLLVFCAPGNAAFTINAAVANVGMAMRQVNRDVAMTGVDPNATSPRTVSATLNADGSATVVLTGTTSYSGGGAFLPTLLGNTLCGISGILSLTVGCKQSSLSIPVLVFADHPFLDSSTTGVAATGWYLRNRWHEVTYYAVASGYRPAALPGQPSCTSGTDCLTVNNLSPTNNKRAILILAGRSLTGAVRPSANLADYLDSTENRDLNQTFEKQPVNRAFNDRIIIVDSN